MQTAVAPDFATDVLQPFDPETSSPESTSLDVHSAYDGSSVLFQLLRMSSWGPGLMNLGWFRFRGWLAGLNLVCNLEFCQRRLVERTLKLLHVQPHHRVLDVACGRGKSSFIMNCIHPQASIIGLDLLEPNIHTAKLLFGGSPRLSYQQGSAMDLEFDDAQFDRVQCLEAAFHFPDRAHFLKEAARVLKPGGRLVVVDFAWRTAADRACLNDRETGIVRDVWQWTDMSTVDEYRSNAKSAGFREVKMLDWSHGVTAPFQKTFDCLISMMRRPWLKKRVLRINPLLATLTESDWNDLAEISNAQDHVRQRTKYMAFVFEKAA